MIERFHVQNYKALRDVELALTPIHVLIGPNDSGKTSILEALAALSRSVEMPLGAAFDGRWEGRELVWSGKDEVTLGGRIFGEGYEVSVKFGRTGRGVFSVSEVIAPHVIPGGGQETVVRVGAANPGNVNGSYLQSIKLIYDGLRGVHVYKWVPKLLGLPCALDAARKYRMDATGFGLALCLDEILGADRALFGDLERRFATLFPEIKSIRLVQESGYRAVINPTMAFPLLQTADGKGLHFEISSPHGVIPASQMSDGVLLVLAYLTVLYLPEPPRLLLVEEPENGIHPGRLREVMTILRELVAEQGHTQVVMTTHSPYVVDLFKPEEVTLCQKGEDGAVRVTRLSESEKVRKQADIFTLGEIWTSEGDEALGTPAAPVVRGA